ncbi:hypothetical protein ACJJTC_012340 [Scirpophaga incertulas]
MPTQVREKIKNVLHTSRDRQATSFQRNESEKEHSTSGKNRKRKSCVKCQYKKKRMTKRASPGRPQKSFIDSSERSNRRKTKDLKSKDLAELTYATQMKLRQAGKIEASKVVKDLTKSPRRA